MLIKKLYQSKNIEKLTKYYSNGEIGQAFVLPTAFIETTCMFFKALNKAVVITVYVIVIEDVFSTHITKRKLSDIEKFDLTKQVKRVFSRSIPNNKIIYIYE